MKLIKLNSFTPHVNLATEEYFLKYAVNYLNDDILIIWKNKNTVVVGCNQNTINEINLLYVNLHNISVVRRITGGGTVFHDDGNINFSFIKRNARKKFNFHDCLSIIIEFLNTHNINAVFSGKNDLVVDQKKISGSAVTFFENDYLIHGTLLFDIDVEKLANCLNVDQKKITSKGIASIKSRIANIKDFLCEKMDVDTFEKQFLKWLEKKYDTQFEYLDLSQNLKVSELVAIKYLNYEYTFGKNYFCNFKNSIKLPNSLLSVNINIDDGNIKDIYFFSDAIFESDLFFIKNKLLHQKYDIDTIKMIFNNLNLNDYYLELTIDKLIDLLFNNM